jgi:hypothetical protein
MRATLRPRSLTRMIAGQSPLAPEVPSRSAPHVQGRVKLSLMPANVPKGHQRHPHVLCRLTRS